MGFMKGGIWAMALPMTHQSAPSPLLRTRQALADVDAGRDISDLFLVHIQSFELAQHRTKALQTSLEIFDDLLRQLIRLRQVIQIGKAFIL